jgi:hypothetical protein
MRNYYEDCIRYNREITEDVIYGAMPLERYTNNQSIPKIYGSMKSQQEMRK